MDEKTIKQAHSINIDERKRLTVTGVTDVGSFDEETLLIYTSCGEMTVRGEELQVVEISLDSGRVIAEGKVDEISYADNMKKDGGFFTRFFG